MEDNKKPSINIKEIVHRFAALHRSFDVNANGGQMRVYNDIIHGVYYDIKSESLGGQQVYFLVIPSYCSATGEDLQFDIDTGAYCKAKSCKDVAQGFVDMHRQFDVEEHGGLTQIYHSLITGKYGEVGRNYNALYCIVIPASQSITGKVEYYEWNRAT